LPRDANPVYRKKVYDMLVSKYSKLKNSTQPIPSQEPTNNVPPNIQESLQSAIGRGILTATPRPPKLHDVPTRDTRMSGILAGIISRSDN
jgi:hypothetical protein